MIGSIDIPSYLAGMGGGVALFAALAALVEWWGKR
jgi:hypothetical protein